MILIPKHAAMSDRGRVRDRNEDNLAADPDHGIFIIADGMGGRLAGGLASQIVVETLPNLIREGLGEADGSFDGSSCEIVTKVLCTLNRVVVEQTRGEPGLESMGTTVVLLLIRDRHALLAHLGDSRAYLLRAGELRLLTRDHNIVQLLLERGEIAAEEVADHPSRGQITRFIGMEEEPLPEVCLVDVQDADRLLLCTDGLTNMLPDREVLNLLIREKSAAEACRRLVSSANAAGGIDNISAIVIDLMEEQEEELRASSALQDPFR